MNRLLTLILTLLLTAQSLISTAQDYRQGFSDRCSRRDTVGEEKLLAEWSAARPHNAELYVAYYNFYVQKSMVESIRIGKNPPPGKDVLQIGGTDSATNEPAGYMYSDVYYKPEILKTAYAYIDTAIQRYPNRLDIRFGKIYILGETKDYEPFTTEIIRMIDHSATNGNNWLWTNNAKQEDPKGLLLGTIQHYQLLLYNTGDDGLLDNMKRIAMAVLAHYPDHVESLSDLSITYMVKGDFKSALTPLLKAEAISPRDGIVLNNIADCYMQTGDRDNAIKYYKLTRKYGDGEVKESARRRLAELKE